MFNYQQWASELLLLFAFTLNLALFLLPGFAAAVLVGSRRKVAPVYLVVLIVATTATLGYASFWVFFASRLAGKAFTFLVYALAFCSIARNYLRPELVRQTIRQIAFPFFLVWLAGVCYLSLFYLFGDPKHYEAGLADARFFEAAQPGDNIIPLIFAERIYNHEPLRPFCCGDWLSSDRPPLQTGIFLLEQPLRLTGVGIDYQLLGMTLQCLWVCGVWCLLTALGAPDCRIRQVIIILTCSGFFFYNSVYTWPKLLAAAYILCALSIGFDVIRAACPVTGFQITLAALCGGLALMAHPGSVFSLPVFGLLLLRHRALFSLRQIRLALSIVVAFYLPWSAYQKFVDPPGNRLLKMHLAGQHSVDGRSAWQSITAAYHDHSWREIFGFKLSNIETLFGDNPLTAFVPISPHHKEVVSSRKAHHGWIWHSVGLLNVGWLGAIWLFFHRRNHSPAVPYSGWLLAGSILNLSVWSIALFGPNGTGIVHSSYADIILLSIGLCGYLFMLPAMAVFAVFALQIWSLMVIWVLFPPVESFAQGIAVELPFLISGSRALGILTWIFTRACFGCESSEQGCTFS